MKIDFENMGKEKYLRIIADAGEERNAFACNMISEAGISGLVSLYHVPDTAGDIYKYNISGLVRLDDYLSDFHGINEMVSIMNQIVAISNGVRSYALSSGTLIYSVSSIYLNISVTREISVGMIAVPLKGIERDGSENLRNLLIQLLDYMSDTGLRVRNVKDYIMECDMKDVEALQNGIAMLKPAPRVQKVEVAQPPAPKKKGILSFVAKKEKAPKAEARPAEKKVVRKDKKAAPVMDSGLCINIPAM